MSTNADIDTISRCDTCEIRHGGICKNLTNIELAEIRKIGIRRQFKRGDVIMSDEMPVDYFCNILRGVVKLNKTASDGRQSIVGLLFPSDFLGRVFAKRNPYFAEAVTDIDVYCFPHIQFEKLIRKYDNLEHRMFEHTLDELDCARDWMFLLGRRTAEEKVASLLILIAKREALIGCKSASPFGDSSFELPLSRADIADYLGLTIETVSRQVSKMKKSGAINLVDQRNITISDMSVLESLADQEL